MKKLFKLNFLFLVFIGISIIGFNNSNIYSQNKNKVRIQAYYFKIMDSVSYLDIKAISKIGKKNTTVSNIKISVFNVQEDETIELGSSITNMDGKARFIIKNFETLKPDSTNTYKINLVFKGDASFLKASKKISFKNANISANLETINDVNFIKAQVLNDDDSPITEESITLRVQRLFKPLILGEDLSITDETGSILTPIEQGIPGVNGKLIVEVVLFESDEYGTVIELVEAPIGVHFTDESTFDERTMWSPRSKTPIFLLIIPNALTLGMWAVIFLLISNLYKISKL